MRSVPHRFWPAVQRIYAGDILSELLQLLWNVVLVKLLLTATIAYAEAYARGAPLLACNSMLPSPSVYNGHGADATDPADHPPPFTIRVYSPDEKETWDYEPGSKKALKVVISGERFKGFMLQARSVLSSEGLRLGQFLRPLPHGTKFVHCDKDRPATVITHKNRKIKQELTFLWKPPVNNFGPINFVATIVQSQQIYWTQVTSAQLLPSRELITDLDLSRCGKGLGCYQYGKRSCAESASCIHSAVWRCSRTEAVFEFLLKLRPTEKQYFGIGLSKDIDFGDDDLIVCTENGTNARSGSYYNSGVKKDIQGSSVPFANLKSANTKGFQYCRISRLLRSGFHLARPYHLFVFSGNITNDGSLQRPEPDNMVMLKKEKLNLCSHPNVFVKAKNSHRKSSAALNRESYLSFFCTVIIFSTLSVSCHF